MLCAMRPPILHIYYIYNNVCEYGTKLSENIIAIVLLGSSLSALVCENWCKCEYRWNRKRRVIGGNMWLMCFSSKLVFFVLFAEFSRIQTTHVIHSSCDVYTNEFHFCVEEDESFFLFRTYLLSEPY